MRRRRLRETKPPHPSLRGHFLPGTLSVPSLPGPPGWQALLSSRELGSGGAWVSDRLDEKMDRRTDGWAGGGGWRTDRRLKG